LSCRVVRNCLYNKLRRNRKLTVGLYKPAIINDENEMSVNGLENHAIGEVC